MLKLVFFFFENPKPPQTQTQETPLAPTGGNILPFFRADVEGRRENGNLKKPKRFAPNPPPTPPKESSLE
jgi:hypothetical protein